MMLGGGGRGEAVVVRCGMCERWSHDQCANQRLS